MEHGRTYTKQDTQIVQLGRQIFCLTLSPFWIWILVWIVGYTWKKGRALSSSSLIQTVTYVLPKACRLFYKRAQSVCSAFWASYRDGESRWGPNARLRAGWLIPRHVVVCMVVVVPMAVEVRMAWKWEQHSNLAGTTSCSLAEVQSETLTCLGVPTAQPVLVEQTESNYLGWVQAVGCSFFSSEAPLAQVGVI